MDHGRGFAIIPLNLSYISLQEFIMSAACQKIKNFPDF